MTTPDTPSPRPGSLINTNLTYDEWRLVLKARELRAAKIGGMLLLKFEQASINIYRLQPDGRLSGSGA